MAELKTRKTEASVERIWTPSRIRGVGAAGGDIRTHGRK